MLSVVESSAILGVDAYGVRVEVNIANTSIANAKISIAFRFIVEPSIMLLCMLILLIFASASWTLWLRA